MGPLSTLQLSVLLLFCLCHCSVARKGRNPCHPNRTVEALGAPCEGVFLPRRLCKACRIAGFDERGFFPDCEAIYAVEEESCMSQLRNYVDENPCDTVRAAQLEDIENPASLKALDYFVYSVCEECCDCIPEMALPEEYEERKATGRSALTNLRRGNCPVHARFDICRVWPEVRHVALPGQELNLNREKVCPMIEEWFKSEDGRNWGRNNNVQVNKTIIRFLSSFNRVARCRNEKIWKRCTTLERAQGRI